MDLNHFNDKMNNRIMFDEGVNCPRCFRVFFNERSLKDHQCLDYFTEIGEILKNKY